MKKKNQARILAQSVYLSIKDKPAKQAEEIVENFLNYLKQKHLVNLAPNILNHLEQLYFEGHNIVATEILSKYDLSQKEIKEISELIENKTASQIKIKQGKDDRLIGGAIIRYKDKIIDLSLKNQLNSLTKQLNT